MTTVKDIYDYLDFLTDFSSCESWDNSGLLIGNPDSGVTSLMMCLDVTADAVDQAAQSGSQLIISHHPIIFHALKGIYSPSATYEAIRNNIAVISAHTCLDSARGGVNDCLAEMLGLKNIESADESCKLIRIGDTEKMTVCELAKLADKVLGSRASFTLPEKEVMKVAVIGGSAGDLYPQAKQMGADCLITGEAKYHEFLQAEQEDFPIIAAGHFETENPVIGMLAKKLSAKFPDIKVMTARQSSPVHYTAN